jgi:HK97 family phage major capsid protein
MFKALELRQERHALSVQMNSLLEKGTPESMKEWRRLDDIQDGLRVKIEAVERQSELNSYMDRVENAERPAVDGGHEPRNITAAEAARSTAGYKAEFRHWLSGGERGPEMRALAVGGDGSTLVPQGFEQELEIQMKYWGGIQNICRVLTTSTGNPMRYPSETDVTSTGEWLTEGSGVGYEDPTFSSVVFGANLLSSKQVKVSVQMEQDSAFDIVGVLQDAFANRLGRTLGAALATGDGSDVPITGLVTALVAAGGRNVLAVGSDSNDGVGTDLNSVGSDDLANLIQNNDYAYQTPGNKFVFNQTTHNALRRLKDKYGRPIWGTSLSGGEPDTILSYGYQVDNNIASIGAGNISVLFGNFQKYVLRKCLGITLVRFNELYMANYQKAYQAFMRLDAKLMQAAAFSYLIHPDS